MTTESARRRSAAIRCSRSIGYSALVFLVLPLVSCSARQEPAPAATTHPSLRVASDESATGWKLNLQIAPERPRMVRPATLSMHLTDRDGKPIENATVTGSLNMVLMDMGKTELKFESKGNGNYEAAVTGFDMSGPWELIADAAQGPVHVHKVFQFIVLD